MNMDRLKEVRKKCKSDILCPECGILYLRGAMV